MGISTSVVSTEVLAATTTAFGDGNKRELAAAVSKIMGITESPEIVAEAIVSLQPKHAQPFTAIDVDGTTPPGAPAAGGKKHQR